MVSTRGVRLTDQALVAVKLARARARGRNPDGAATAADVLAALTVEQEGAAGQLLRARSSAAAGLAELPSEGLAFIDDVVAEASAAAAPRPTATLDLLYAALDLGGAPLTALLERAGWEPGDLRAVAPGPAGETLGLGADEALAPAAAVAVARTRAAGGDTVDLLYELADGPDADTLELDLPSRRPDTDAETGASLAGVVEAARRFRSEGAVTTTDLVRAAFVVGGPAARRLLEPSDA